MEKERTGITARSGDTHVIDGSVDNAEAVNIEAPTPTPAKLQKPAAPSANTSGRVLAARDPATHTE